MLIRIYKNMTHGENSPEELRGVIWIPKGWELRPTLRLIFFPTLSSKLRQYYLQQRHVLNYKERPGASSWYSLRILITTASPFPYHPSLEMGSGYLFQAGCGYGIESRMNKVETRGNVMIGTFGLKTKGFLWTRLRTQIPQCWLEVISTWRKSLCKSLTF